MSQAIFPGIRHTKSCLSSILTTILVLTCLGCGTARSTVGTGEFLLYDAAGIDAVETKLANGDTRLKAILDDVVADADEYLEVDSVSVADKPKPPPSGDYQDYVSMSPYWWANPDTADGKPYIRRDGQFNPERNDYDVPRLDTATRSVHALALAYRFTGDDRYAEHAVRHLRKFFINPETRMNPNLQFAQFVPGVAENGRPAGIIETVRLRFTPDSLVLLRGSDHYTEEDDAAMQAWFGDYVQWLLTSEHGINEGEAENNHGTWYHQQVVLYSLFAGDEASARAALDRVPARIADQIEPDGSQPHENSRTRSLHYCDFNNRAYMDMARLGERLGVDLWNFETEDGRSLRKSLDFHAPYMTGENPDWPHKRPENPHYKWFAQSFRWAAIGFDDPAFENRISQLPDGFGEVAWIELVVPAE